MNEQGGRKERRPELAAAIGDQAQKVPAISRTAAAVGSVAGGAEPLRLLSGSSAASGIENPPFDAVGMHLAHHLGAQRSGPPCFPAPWCRSRGGGYRVGWREAGLAPDERHRVALPAPGDASAGRSRVAKAPYLTALVASSCTAMPRICAACALRRSVGPSTRMRVVLDRAERIDLADQQFPEIDARPRHGRAAGRSSGRGPMMRFSKLDTNSGTESAPRAVCLAIAAMTVIWFLRCDAPVRASGTAPRSRPPADVATPRPARSKPFRSRRWGSGAPRPAARHPAAWHRPRARAPSGRC